jgi:protoheme IX farnesyltransferase
LLVFGGSICISAWLVVRAHQLYARVHRDEPVEPLRLFKRSNTYLALVFCALAIDSALALPNLVGP